LAKEWYDKETMESGTEWPIPPDLEQLPSLRSSASPSMETNNRQLSLNGYSQLVVTVIIIVAYIFIIVAIQVQPKFRAAIAVIIPSTSKDRGRISTCALPRLYSCHGFFTQPMNPMLRHSACAVGLSARLIIYVSRRREHGWVQPWNLFPTCYLPVLLFQYFKRRLEIGTEASVFCPTLIENLRDEAA